MTTALTSGTEWERCHLTLIWPQLMMLGMHVLQRKGPTATQQRSGGDPPHRSARTAAARRSAGTSRARPSAPLCASAGPASSDASARRQTQREDLHKIIYYLFAWQLADGSNCSRGSSRAQGMLGDPRKLADSKHLLGYLSNLAC